MTAKNKLPFKPWTKSQSEAILGWKSKEQKTFSKKFKATIKMHKYLVERGICKVVSEDVSYITFERI